MKRVISLVSVFCILLASGNASNASTFESKNPKIQSTYNRIMKKIKSDMRLKPALSEDSKLKISNEISNINSYFMALEKFVSINDNKSGNQQIENIKNSMNMINAYLKDFKTSDISVKNMIGDSVKQPGNVSSNAKYGELMYYNDSFEGKKTANGNIYSQNFFSAAKCNVPLNTFIQTIFNSKSLLVKVNDRPNCSRFPNLVDMTTTSFDFLTKRFQGTKKAEFIEVSKVPGNYYKAYIKEDFFSKANVNLNQKIPNSYMVNETLNIGGKILNDNRTLKLIIRYPGQREVTLEKNDIDKYFLYSIPLDEKGEYRIRFESDSISSDTFSIYVFDRNEFNGKRLFDENISFLGDLKIENEHIAKGFEAYRARIGGNNLNQIIFSQGDRKYSFYGIGDVVFFKESLVGFDLSENINIEILSSKTITGFSHDFYSVFYKIFSGGFILQ
ncbi:MAG: hypothetical protein PHS92_00775 [Candidatus Gracilibacteria bacterium]|nr:hypothetical protein [Candidatus Gracilibacteria bacterium]